jgi:hypothetical protein
MQNKKSTIVIGMVKNVYKANFAEQLKRPVNSDHDGEVPDLVASEDYDFSCQTNPTF